MEKSVSTGLRYTQVVSAIEEEIKTGVLQYGERLKNEKWLCETYGVSRTTLRKAIDELIAAGLVERRSNKGVYVTYSKFDSNFDRPISIFQELLRAGIRPSSKILSFARIKAAGEVSQSLRCPEGEPLLHIHRVRYADDRPFNINDIYLVERMFPQFNPWLLTNRSLHEIIKSEYKLEIVKSIQRVNAVAATRHQAEYLEVPLRTPLLTTVSTVIAGDGEVVEYQQSWINTSVVPYSYKYTWQ